MSSIDSLLGLKNHDPVAIKKWINSTINDSTGDDKLVELIMKLQLLSNDIDTSLDKLQDRLTQSMPGFRAVLKDISNESSSLRSDFVNITNDINVMNHRNHNLMGKLSTVYDVSKKMNLCIDSLSEIHNWEQRVSKIEKLFDSRNSESDTLDIISKELKIMSQRVEMLKKNMPELYSQRSLILNEFVDNLENMVIPHILDTIESKNYRNFRYYSAIMYDINKQSEIKKLYLISRLDTIRELTAHFSHSTSNVSMSPTKQARNSIEQRRRKFSQQKHLSAPNNKRQQNNSLSGISEENSESEIKSDQVESLLLMFCGVGEYSVLFVFYVFCARMMKMVQQMIITIILIIHVHLIKNEYDY